MTMHNRLDAILLKKQHEIVALHTAIRSDSEHPVGKLIRGEYDLAPAPSFKQALRSQSLAIIAEIKRKSPSKGDLAAIPDPVHLAQQYQAGGASALSILTDQSFFGGALQDLTLVAQQLQPPAIPILRKDFMIDRVQIAEAKFAGASAILLIAAVLGTKMQPLLDYAKSIGLDVLVEIHTALELQLALASGADIIGINNRDLKTFSVNTENALELGALVPAHITKVAESGISDPALARVYAQAGFDAVLIGEALVTTAQPAAFIRACRYD